MSIDIVQNYSVPTASFANLTQYELGIAQDVQLSDFPVIRKIDERLSNSGDEQENSVLIGIQEPGSELLYCQKFVFEKFNQFSTMKKSHPVHFRMAKIEVTRLNCRIVAQ